MSLKKTLKFLKKKPSTFDDCITYARQKFEKYFNHDIKQLLHVYPLDKQTKEGHYFWTLPKRPPTPVEFDVNNQLHCQFVSSLACLRANLFKIPIPSDKPRSDDFKIKIAT